MNTTTINRPARWTRMLPGYYAMIGGNATVIRESGDIFWSVLIDAEVVSQAQTLKQAKSIAADLATRAW